MWGARRDWLFPGEDWSGNVLRTGPGDLRGRCRTSWKRQSAFLSHPCLGAASISPGSTFLLLESAASWALTRRRPQVWRREKKLASYFCEHRPRQTSF